MKQTTHEAVMELAMDTAFIDLFGRACYWNCEKIMNGIGRYKDATYVEGVAVHPQRELFYHGWIEFEGVVHDPTPPAKDGDRRFLYYFGALRFDGLTAIETAKCRIPKHPAYPEDFPIFKRFGPNGEEHPDFVQAIAAARAAFPDTPCKEPYELDL